MIVATFAIAIVSYVISVLLAIITPWKQWVVIVILRKTDLCTGALCTKPQIKFDLKKYLLEYIGIHSINCR